MAHAAARTSLNKYLSRAQDLEKFAAEAVEYLHVSEPQPATVVIPFTELVAEALANAGASHDLGNFYFDAASFLDERPSSAAEALALLTTAVRYYAKARPLLPNDQSKAMSFLNEASAHCNLSQHSSNPVYHSRQAIRLSRKAQSYFRHREKHLMGSCLGTEAIAWTDIARHHRLPKVLQHRALQLYRRAILCLDPQSAAAGICLYTEAAFRMDIAAFRPNGAKTHYERAIQMCRTAALLLARGSPSYGRALATEATALIESASLTKDPAESCRRALIRLRQASACYPPDSFDRAVCLLHEINARLELTWNSRMSKSHGYTWLRLLERNRSLVGAQPVLMALCDIASARIWLRLVDLREPAETCCRRAIDLLESASPHLVSELHQARCQFNLAHAYLRLAEAGKSPRANSHTAERLYLQISGWFSRKSTDAGWASLGRVSSALVLAEFGIKSASHLRAGLKLLRAARDCFPSSSPEIGNSLVNEARTWIHLADVTANRADCFRRARTLLERAKFCVAADSLEAGRCHFYRGCVSEYFAGEGPASLRALEAALILYRQARIRFPPASGWFASCELREIRTLSRMARIAPSKVSAFQRASRRLSRVVRAFDPASPLRIHALQLYAENLRPSDSLSGRQGLRNRQLKKVIKLVSQEIIPAIEQTSLALADHSDRRTFHETVRDIFTQAISLCLELADLETRQATEWRWQAWRWVQQAKARTFRERLAFSGMEQGEQDPSLGKELNSAITAILQELQKSGSGHGQSVIDRPELMRPLNEILQKLGAEIPFVQIADTLLNQPRFATACARRGNAGRPLIVVEFFSADQGRLGAFVYFPSRPMNLPEPLWLPGGQAAVRDLAARLVKATRIICGDGRRSIRGAPKRGIRPRSVELEEAHAELWEITDSLGDLLAPLRVALSHPEYRQSTLVLCPTRLMYLLPLCAARWSARSGDREHPLIAEHPLVCLPSASVHPGAFSTTRRPLAYLAAADRSGTLETIEDEIAEAAIELKKRGFRVRQFSGARATADTAWNHATEASVIHLAMHSSQNGCFELEGAEFHDRTLTILEMTAWLKFRRAALAIITSCSSSRVVDVEADDPSAISFAWMLAGARSVIGGLWDLEDRSASRFATAFYTHWAGRGANLAEAVQAAVLDVRAVNPDDLYGWSPFVLMGSGATKIDELIDSHPRPVTVKPEE